MQCGYEFGSPDDYPDGDPPEECGGEHVCILNYGHDLEDGSEHECACGESQQDPENY